VWASPLRHYGARAIDDRQPDRDRGERIQRGRIHTVERRRSGFTGVVAVGVVSATELATVTTRVIGTRRRCVDGVPTRKLRLSHRGGGRGRSRSSVQVAEEEFYAGEGMAAEELLHQVEVPTSQCRQDVSVVLDASNARGDERLTYVFGIPGDASIRLVALGAR
jgi:hypothetical protein